MSSNLEHKNWTSNEASSMRSAFFGWPLGFKATLFGSVFGWAWLGLSWSISTMPQFLFLLQVALANDSVFSLRVACAEYCKSRAMCCPSPTTVASIQYSTKLAAIPHAYVYQKQRLSYEQVSVSYAKNVIKFCLVVVERSST